MLFQTHINAAGTWSWFMEAESHTESLVLHLCIQLQWNLVYYFSLRNYYMWNGHLLWFVKKGQVCQGKPSCFKEFYGKLKEDQDQQKLQPLCLTTRLSQRITDKKNTQVSIKLRAKIQNPRYLGTINSRQFWLGLKSDTWVVCFSKWQAINTELALTWHHRWRHRTLLGNCCSICLRYWNLQIIFFVLFCLLQA